jgi:hypothetical protein
MAHGRIRQAPVTIDALGTCLPSIDKSRRMASSQLLGVMRRLLFQRLREGVPRTGNWRGEAALCRQGCPIGEGLEMARGRWDEPGLGWPYHTGFWPHNWLPMKFWSTPIAPGFIRTPTKRRRISSGPGTCRIERFPWGVLVRHLKWLVSLFSWRPKPAPTSPGTLW